MNQKVRDNGIFIFKLFTLLYLLLLSLGFTFRILVNASKRLSNSKLYRAMKITKVKQLTELQDCTSTTSFFKRILLQLICDKFVNKNYSVGFHMNKIVKFITQESLNLELRYQVGHIKLWRNVSIILCEIEDRVTNTLITNTCITNIYIILTNYRMTFISWHNPCPI